MKKFVMQVKVQEFGKEVWKDVKSSSGKRYEYDTPIEAYHMLDVCYGAPEHAGKAKVVPVEV